MKLITEHTQDVQYLTESAADGKSSKPLTASSHRLVQNHILPKVK
jgi:hypothetical protein